MTIQRTTENVTAKISHLIRILVENLQTDPYAPIREYISNAHDATLQEENPIINLWCERDSIHILDNGCGMTKRVIMEAYTRIAGHFNNSEDVKTIGMFGIGVLSAFIVAKKLVVKTRSLEEAHGWQLEWKRFDETFTLEPIEKVDAGTEAILVLDEESLVLASERELEAYINRTFSLFTTPIYVGNTLKKAANQQHQWLKGLNKSQVGAKLMVGEELRKIMGLYFRSNLLCGYYSKDEEGNQIFLGIPDTESSPIVDKHSVCFFSKGVLVHGNMRDFYPENLSFVVGLMDSPNFKLQITREDIFICDNQFTAIKNRMAKEIFNFLNLLATHHPNVIENVLRIHRTKLVAQCREYEPMCDLFKDHYHFMTSSGELRWKEILPFAEKLPDDERLLYYTSNEFKAYDNLYGAKSFLTIYAFGAEQYVLQQIAECDVVTLKDIATLESGEGDMEVPVPFQQLAHKITTHLGRKSISKVTFIRLPGDKQVPTLFRVITSDGTLMHPDGVSDPRSGMSVRIDALMLNIAHPLIGKLAGKRNLSYQQYQKIAQILYQIAVLHSPFNDLHLSSSEDVIMNLVEGIELQIGAKKNRDTFGPEAPDCFVALPYRPEFDVTWQAVFSVLSASPYNWKLTRADKSVEAVNLIDNIRSSITMSRRFIADISGLNPNVLIEVGLMLETDEDSLLLLCDDLTQPQIPVDLRGRVFLIYPATLRQNPPALNTFMEEKIKLFTEWISLMGSKK